MSFADPQSIKVGETTSELPRVDVGSFKSSYLSADGTLRLSAATTENGKRKRQVLRIDQTKITEDPFDTTQNVEVSMSCYMVFDRPLAGFDNTAALALAAGLIENATASTNKNLKKLLASES